jgi:predicted RNA binding protein YcfA (HicA-like mRNA interferase family)
MVRQSLNLNLLVFRMFWLPEMGKVPVLKPKEILTILVQVGFRETRQRGSHKQFRHPDGRGTTVPFHTGRDISPVLLR